MLFNSYVFMFVFLPAVLALYAFTRRRPERQWTIGLLVVASLFYYGWWKPEFVLLLLVSIAVNAGFGRILCSGRLSRSASRTVLTFGTAFNLGVLGYFKYAGFFVENLNDWFDTGFPIPKIVLPIGISFITFQKIAFLVDAHRGAVRNFTFPNFALFVTFFPQLIAGPIVHHAEMMPQFQKRRLPGDFYTDLAVGLSIFCVGLFKKVVIADSCAVYADAGYDTLKAGHPLDAASGWIAVIAYSFQIYYDFSGYSDMAVGLARMFGIQLPVNFHSPYKATGIIEFWRRWHMTLSRFLREYLYFPLGGNRHGRIRQYANLSVVMLLGGLWHGANWTFVVWGAAHAVMLAINHAWQSLPAPKLPSWMGRLARVGSVALTFVAVTLAWVPFRAESFTQAKQMLQTLVPAPWQLSAAWASFKHAWQVQLARGALDLMTWFKPRELWPSVLPPEFLATVKPAGLLLLFIGVATLLSPNTQQIFARFHPVLGLSESQLENRWSLGTLNWKPALIVSGIFVFSVLQLSHVSPFLYFQF